MTDEDLELEEEALESENEAQEAEAEPTNAKEPPRTEEFTRYKPEECFGTTKTNPVKAIRLKCLDCSGWSSHEVAHCEVTRCPLYVFRFGKNPFRSVVEREYTEEERAAMRERMRNLMGMRKNQD